MKKSTALSIALLILLLTLTGCAGSVGDGTNTDGEGMDVNTSEERWAAIPAVFVNDTYFRFYKDELHHPSQNLDSTWVSLGNIQSAAPDGEAPAQNFQTNNETLIGAEVFFSSGGRIPVANSAWGDPLDEEIAGDIVIVVYKRSRLWYISEESHSEVVAIMDMAERHSLMVDGLMYSLMARARGGAFSLNDDHIFLGEVMSAVPMSEYPAENLQANRDTVIGAKVYRLPSNESSDIVVFFNPDARFYYSHLP
jgi:hypothetical protein